MKIRTLNTGPGPPATAHPRGSAVRSRSSCDEVGRDTDAHALAPAPAPAGWRLQGQAATIVPTLILVRVLNIS